MDLLATSKLRKALGSPGCPICRIGDEDGRHYLATVLHEYVNDWSTRTRLTDSWGFCRRHAWSFLSLEWGRFHDGMSTANLTQWQVSRVLEVLREVSAPPPRRRRLGRPRPDPFLSSLGSRFQPGRQCPACESQQQGEHYALRVLLEHLGEDGEISRLYRASSGVCFGHLRVALEEPDLDAGLRTLVALQRARLEGLYVELEEYLRKHDYRFAGEPYASELDAFIRATEFLAGSWTDLAGRPAIEGWEARRAELTTGGRAVVCHLCHTARLRSETKPGPSDLDVAVCTDCIERWNTAGRQCVKCGEPVPSGEDVGCLPGAGGLGHVDCGGVRLRQ